MGEMIQRLFDIIRYVFRAGRGIRCTVIERADGKVTATGALVDEEGYRLVVFRRRTYSSFETFKKPLLHQDRIVLSLDSSGATTIEDSMRISRENASEVITEEELEQLLFKGFWAFLNAHRSWTAKKMETSDVDLVLANIEVTDAALGKHNVVNPIGLKGKSIRVRFRGTFAPRALLPLIGSLRRKTRELDVVETDAALASLLAVEKGIVLFCRKEAVTLFSIMPGAYRYVRTMPWNADEYFASIAKKFALDQKTAEALFAKYAEGGASPRVSNFFERHLRRLFEELFRRLMESERRRFAYSRAPVHINCYFPMPAGSKWFTMRRAVSLHSLERRMNELRITATRQVPLSTALLFFYPASYPKREFLDQMLRRRAKWLIAYS